MERALHPELAKRPGKADRGAPGFLGTLTASEMIAATAAGFGKTRDVPDRQIEVEVVDVFGGIASAISAVCRLPRVPASRAHAGRMEDRECPVAVDAGPRALTEAAQNTSARAAAEEALLDAAERLLVDVGYAGITTRRLAGQAGVNHGLVHYYFGSNENLMVRTLQGFTGRLIARQRALYAADLPFIEKWRQAMRYLVSDDVTCQKIWLELQELTWNHPDLRERRVNAQWRAVLMHALEQPRPEHGIEMPLEALVSLVLTFNVGVMVERPAGIETGHHALLDWIDRWLSG